MPYSPILATLGYVFSQDGSEVLMVHRIARENDAHFGKYNGLGGKLESNEDVVSGFRREVREEAGIECNELHLAGTISWPGFGRNGEDWFGFIFRVTSWFGEMRNSNEEGPLLWIPVSQVMMLALWEGDRHFLPLILERSPQFHGIMPYENGKPISWSYSTLCV